MRPSVGRLAGGLLAACALASVTSVPAQAQIAFAPCGESNEVACGHLTVPLDPSGAVPGTVTLALHRHRAAVGDERSAIIALAGGPGQPALPFTEAFAEQLGPLAATRDLIAFDQRGIGLSGALSCHALERSGTFHAIGRLIEACASQLGTARAFYTSADTVADIEAIRQAGGYEKLVLYGTSYGTKVAELYAQAYPSHVEGLILDSVVPPNGPDPLNRATFAAIPRILRQLCAAHACAQVTANPVGDLGRVLDSANRASLGGQAIDGEGKAHQVQIVPGEIFGMLLAGDFSPLLRAELLTADASAARGDTAPLARLLVTASNSEGEGEDFDAPLYYATSCEEQSFPWNRASDPRQRLKQAAAAANALPAATFAPFTAGNAIEGGNLTPCAYWPFPTAAAPAPDVAPLPNVPTLILSGQDDLRTPTANASEVAAQIPDSHLLVVPLTGHSVLGSEPTPCARTAMLALFSTNEIKPCRASTLPASLRPPPRPPLRLALVSPAAGYHGASGRTLHAVAFTLGDALRQLLLSIGSLNLSEGQRLPTLGAGGLRAGWVHDHAGTLTFHDYSYIPGMTISGTVGVESADLRIGGSAAAHGVLRLGANRALVGALGAVHVLLSASSIASAAIVDNYETAPRSARGRAAVLAGIRQLSRVLSWGQP
jgi:pimeloyl-ACP methyl ester carboxylesterase